MVQPLHLSQPRTQSQAGNTPKLDAQPTRDELSQRRDALLQLAHPQIVPILLYKTGSYIRLVTRAQPGPTLADQLAWRRQIPYGKAEVIELLTPIVDALEYAHQRGVAHGNLHPAAIVQMPDGPVLTEFGAVGQPGPAEYRAPEHERTPYSKRGDVYALAMIVYEMMTGTYPGSDMQPIGVLAPGVDAVLARGLAQNPRDRYRSPREFLQALIACQVKPHRATTASTGFPIRPFVIALAIVLAAFCASLLVGVLVGMLL